MPTRRVEFEGATGARLAGVLNEPQEAQPRAYALFAHCFTCSKDLKAAVNISRALATEGIAVLRFDFTGLGESAGEFAATTFSSNVGDLVAAAGFLEREYAPPALLVGHSLGGAAVLQAAPRIASTRAVATIGAPADPQHVRHLLKNSEATILARGEAQVEIAGRRFRIGRQFLEDLEEVRMRQVIAALRCALLIFHAPLDEVVGIENAARIFQAAHHPKSFVALPGADHLLSDERDAHYAGRVLAAWVETYLEPRAKPPA